MTKNILLVIALLCSFAEAQERLQFRRGNTAGLPTGNNGEPLWARDSLDFYVYTTDSGKAAYVGGYSLLWGKALYGVDTGSTDAYAITLFHAPGKYHNGMTLRFVANTANTGAATLNVNSLGAKSIRKGKNVSDTLSTGDIATDQLVQVTYVDSVFQLGASAGSNNKLKLAVLPDAGNYTTSSGWTAGDGYDIYYSWFNISTNITADSIGCYLVSGGASGDSIAFALYNQDGTVLLCQTGWIIMGTTNATRIVDAFSSSPTLTPGTYIVAYAFNNATSPPTMGIMGAGGGFYYTWWEDMTEPMTTRRLGVHASGQFSTFPSALSGGEWNAAAGPLMMLLIGE